ncbi:MAG: hypothetical protein AAF993_18210 [Pseudomonadota bacterium]
MLAQSAAHLSRLLLLLLSPPLLAAGIAEKPIPGGLGVEFAKPLDSARHGAETAFVPMMALPDNREFVMPELEPGAILPWRHFTDIVLPRPIRQHAHQSFVMLDHDNHPVRVTTQVNTPGCDKNFDWLKETVSKKYSVRGETEISPSDGYTRQIRIVFIDKQIDMACGPHLLIQYLDFSRLKRWAVAQHKRYQSYERNELDNEKRRMVLDRRRSVQFADAFTLGDRFKLEGAFGIQFDQPFAKNSTQVFPIDVPFYAVLPNLPPQFANGDIQLVIAPDKYPIVIRGTFRQVDFDQVKNALRAKYGTPLKSTDRHVIHKVSSHHAILKKIAADTIEMAFINTVAQAEQRNRLWGQESEGL